MYNLPYFKEEDRQVVTRFIYDHPFAFLSGCNSSGMPVVTQIPMFIEERNGKMFLMGHLMKQTDHHKAFLQNPNALAVFTGPHCYVSATWYSNPQQGSTWNYMSVHVKGLIHFLKEDALIHVLKHITMRFENQNAESATVFDNLPEDYRRRLMPAIIAFEIEVTEIENVFKLSQNRDEKSYLSIIQHLEQQGGDGAMIADEMKRRTSQLFSPDKEWNSEKFFS